MTSNLFAVLAWAIGLELSNPLAWIAAAAVLTDAATTIVGMRRPRLGENFPVQRWAIVNLGLVPGVVLLHVIPILSAFVLGPVLWVFFGLQLHPASHITMAIAFGLVAANNVRLILRT